MQHRKQLEAEQLDENTVPKLSMDYIFMSSKDEEAKGNPLRGVIEESTGQKYARTTRNRFRSKVGNQIG